MTGYGIASFDSGSTKYTVEVKSLNSKFLELSLRLPKIFAEKEFQLRNDCSKLIERGKVNLSINTEQVSQSVKAAGIDKDLLKHYYNQLKSVSEELGEPTGNLLQLALGLPEVVKYEEDTISEDEWKAVEKTFQQAMAAFQDFRSQEGNVIEQEIKGRINTILKNLELVELEDPKRVPLIKERLNTFLAEAASREAIDQNRFEQELIYYIDKLDITEEKVRLKAHCEYFIETLKNADANGKKLGFISQEIGREINTLGSKANDANIQKLVVGMKEELEKIKEQLLNVL
ncbi:YicC family protein [Mucilaginibacter rubeus]|uniref:YicC family protein n=2 Tax=Sphingobacteriaceae TaxID=84566 RepID=A0AAE6MMN2_9SPHI|nr:YicC/YloC family endoribonuclease [Mucilaginibacter rubeus]QEM20803.1 YicC family protein [Mucilaginibacter gossypii]QEM08362.1 YicC family protein [Mucilaginibacter rubeus]QTE46946.1 YicC family protein [Mucilaginibacter rubeus]QTE53548.1 YicC family protein [Mucilaginibacter rubeus]QTE60352.1 YicC family protein [Mucilaginibacter rubeus]